MTVPTPLIWSTRTAMARCPTGTWTLMIVPVCPPFSVDAVICAPVATGWRAICPMTCDGSEGAWADRGERDGDRLHLLGLDPRRQRAIGCGNDDRSFGRGLHLAVVAAAWAADEQQDPHE